MLHTLKEISHVFSDYYKPYKGWNSAATPHIHLFPSQFDTYFHKSHILQGLSWFI